MKSLFVIVFLLFGLGSYAQQPERTKYDGSQMKEYFFVMLKRGANRSQDSLTVQKLDAGHIANIQKMADEGKLVIAGPFGDDGDWRSIFIFKTKTIDEAKALVEKGPMIVAGRLAYVNHPLWMMKGAKLD